MQSLRAYNLSPKQSSAAKRKKLSANPSGLSRKHESKPTSPTAVCLSLLIALQELVYLEEAYAQRDS